VCVGLVTAKKEPQRRADRQKFSLRLPCALAVSAVNCILLSFIVAALMAFLIAFFFSFIGSIPPGTLNLSIIQLGLDDKINVAWRFALAAAVVEYPYAWVAVKFSDLITSSPVIADNIQLIAAVVMIVLGIIDFLPAQKSSPLIRKFNNSGFRRGIVLSVLNPLALPFWVGVTAYLKSQGWIDLSTTLALHGYLLGISLGALVLLMLLAYMARKIVTKFSDLSRLKRIPGVMLLAFGLYALVQYLL
jgi:threonine/homoserine/homoserine lactone efflux protein